jgi:heat shock protein HtpX
MAAYGLYTHIASNKTKSMLLLGGLFLLVYVIVYAGALVIEVVSTNDAPFDYYLKAALADVIRTLPYSTGAALLWIVIAYFFHQSIIDAVTGGRDVTRQEQPRLYNLLENLCISRGIPMPKLKVMDSDALNAFATGLNRRQYAVTVTTGLLNTLNDQEMEAVLGHELTHIRNGDVQMMVIAVIIAGVVGFFAELLFRGFGNYGYGWGWGGGGYSSSSSSSESSSGDRKGSGGGAAILVIQESRRHDLGAAQDRGPWRAARRHLGGDGALRRQSARGVCRHLCDPPFGRGAGRRAGEICRRPLRGPAGAADASGGA